MYAFNTLGPDLLGEDDSCLFTPNAWEGDYAEAFGEDALSVSSGLGDTLDVGEDLNFDGVPDHYTYTADSNNDGIEDVFISEMDTDGDGIYDTVIKGDDYNADGFIDSATSYHDTSGDGVFDTTVKMFDKDGDGSLDHMDAWVDVNGDGQADEHWREEMTPASFYMPYGEPVAPQSFISGSYAEDLEQFTPTDSYPADISGDPLSSMDCWEYQGSTNRCALYSQKFVIEELTGVEIDMEEFADTAEQNGWFTEEGGTTFLNMNKMLDAYGVENELGFHKDISDIESCLNDGGKVIVALDSDQIWYGADSNIFSPASSADHAVEVIGIDRSDPSAPMVILNDSGSPYGKGSMVPLDVFEKAWQDGNCEMIACYPS